MKAPKELGGLEPISILEDFKTSQNAQLLGAVDMKIDERFKKIEP